MPAMDQDALAEIKRLEAAGSFWAVETVRDSDAIRYMRHAREYDGATIAYTSKVQPQSSNWARNEDLLTGRPTLALPRSCHNA